MGRRIATVAASGVLLGTLFGLSRVVSDAEVEPVVSEGLPPDVVDKILEQRRNAMELHQQREQYFRDHPELWNCDDFVEIASGDPETSLVQAFVGSFAFCGNEYDDPSDQGALVTHEELCEVDSSSHHIQLAPGDWCELEVVSSELESDAYDDDDAQTCSHTFKGTVTAGYVGAFDITTLRDFSKIADEYSSQTYLDDLCRKLVYSANSMLTDTSPVWDPEEEVSKFPSLEVCSDTLPDCAEGGIDDDCDTDIDSYEEERQEMVEACEQQCFPAFEEAGEDASACLAICSMGSAELMDCYRICDEDAVHEDEAVSCEIACEEGLPNDEYDFLVGISE